MAGIFDSHHGVALNRGRFHSRRASLLVRTVQRATPKLPLPAGLVVDASVRLAVVVDAHEATIGPEDSGEERKV